MCMDTDYRHSEYFWVMRSQVIFYSPNFFSKYACLKSGHFGGTLPRNSCAQKPVYRETLCTEKPWGTETLSTAGGATVRVCCGQSGAAVKPIYEKGDMCLGHFNQWLLLTSQEGTRQSY